MINLSLILILTNCNKEKITTSDSSFQYSEDGVVKNDLISAKIYEDGSITLRGVNLFLFMDETSLDTIFLSQNSYSHAISYPENNEREYSPNISENPNGFIKIDQYNEDTQTISGKFSFVGFHESKSVSIENGSFENIQLENQIGTYKDGKISSLIDDSFIKYSNVEITDSLSFIHLFIQHPTKREVSLQIPKNINIGNNVIVESNIANKEEIVLWFKQTTNGFTFHTPIENCNLEIDEFDFEHKILKGNLTGKFENGLDEVIDIKTFELSLNWN